MSQFELNTDTERLQIIFGDDTELEQTQRFAAGENRLHVKGNPIGPATAEALIEGGFVAPDRSHNDAPTAQTLVDIANRYESRTPPTVHAWIAGYVTPARRDDARVMFDTIHLASRDGDVTEEVQEDFLGEFTGRQRPNERHKDASGCYAWWD
jgi:hypothetical protein